MTFGISGFKVVDGDDQNPFSVGQWAWLKFEARAEQGQGARVIPKTRAIRATIWWPLGHGLVARAYPLSHPQASGTSLGVGGRLRPSCDIQDQTQ